MDLADMKSAESEMQVVQLSTDVLEGQFDQPVHLLTKQDPLDDAAASDLSNWQMRSQPSGRQYPLTPRQRKIRDYIKLPFLRRYPLAPGCTSDQSEEYQRRELMRVYEEFVLDLHKGIKMTQLTSNQEHSRIHCQILEDLQTLKVDQGSGCIIEFPLDAVSKVYRIVKSDDSWFPADYNGGKTRTRSEHIVVVEFRKRKLAFLFEDLGSASCFLLCMELLIRRAHEVRLEMMSQERQASRPKDMRPLFTGFPLQASAIREAASTKPASEETPWEALPQAALPVAVPQATLPVPPRRGGLSPRRGVLQDLAPPSGIRPSAEGQLEDPPAPTPALPAPALSPLQEESQMDERNPVVQV